MIQRKQSLWLLLAALLNAGAFICDLYKYDTVVNGVTERKGLHVTDHFPTLIIALVATLLPFVTIFMFANRKRQMRMTAVSLITTGSFISTALIRVTRITPEPVNGSYWIGIILPVAAMIFLILAMAGIRRDEKLVRSVDRLR
ncbi:MAG: DUF4293 domain-containing protein [Bacteroidota bacterium]